jgi:hypothetical protein
MAIERVFNSGDNFMTEKPNDLDYLYMMSYLLRSKITKLDNMEKLDKIGNIVRKKLINKNMNINNFIRDISLRYFQKGSYNVNVKEMLGKA